MNYLCIAMTSHTKTLFARWTWTWMTIQWAGMLTTFWSFFRTHFFAFHTFNSSLKDLSSITVCHPKVLLHQLIWLHPWLHGKDYCKDDFDISVLENIIDHSRMDEPMHMERFSTNQKNELFHLQIKDFQSYSMLTKASHCHWNITCWTW